MLLLASYCVLVDVSMETERMDFLKLLTKNGNKNKNQSARCSRAIEILNWSKITFTYRRCMLIDSC